MKESEWSEVAPVEFFVFTCVVFWMCCDARPVIRFLPFIGVASREWIRELVYRSPPDLNLGGATAPDQESVVEFNMRPSVSGVLVEEIMNIRMLQSDNPYITP